MDPERQWNEGFVECGPKFVGML